tara:strand:+ start:22 stop:426 length:405 start_codon:yes stop_codon:yes gene_type:complete
MKKILYMVFPTLILLTACGPQNKHSIEDANSTTTQVANTLDDISKTIRTVQETAVQVKKFSEDVATAGERVKDFEGVKLLESADWEYKVISMEPAANEVIEEQLNALGKQGWELVSMQGGKNKVPQLLFKRLAR